MLSSFTFTARHRLRVPHKVLDQTLQHHLSLLSRVLWFHLFQLSVWMGCVCACACVCVCVLHGLKRPSILSSLISQCWIRSFSKVQISFLVFASAVQRDFDMKQGHGCRGTALNIACLLRCYLHGPVHIDILVWLAGGLLNKIGSYALWTSCRNSHRLMQEIKWI